MKPGDYREILLFKILYFSGGAGLVVDWKEQES
jgi:hypothetical protein